MTRKHGNPKFFTQDRCDRCGGDLSVRIMSWFTTETLCLDCSEDEDEIKDALRDRGDDPADYEGCGHVPEIEDDD